MNKVYTEYCLSYSSVLDIIEECQKSSDLAKVFVECRRDDPHRLDISDYLIKPIQRLTKYPLLFKQAMKAFDSASKEFYYLELCFNTVQKIATLVDERKQKIESIEKTCKFLNRLSLGPVNFF